MPLRDLLKLQGSFGYKLCALYLPQRYRSNTMSEVLRMLVAGLGEEWRDKAMLDDVCMELELAGVEQAGMLRSVVLAGFGEGIEEEYADARGAARWITQQDNKLGVWVACACAREVLKYVGEGENRPRAAIETTEAWVRGEATREQVREAANAASAAYYSAYVAANAANAASGGYAAAIYTVKAAWVNAAYAAWSAADAGTADDASASAAYAVDYAARAMRNTTRDAEIRRFVSVIARSLQTFPVLLTVPE